MRCGSRVWLYCLRAGDGSDVLNPSLPSGCSEGGPDSSPGSARPDGLGPHRGRRPCPGFSSTGPFGRGVSSTGRDSWSGGTHGVRSRWRHVLPSSSPVHPVGSAPRPWCRTRGRLVQAGTLLVDLDLTGGGIDVTCGIDHVEGLPLARSQGRARWSTPICSSGPCRHRAGAPCSLPAPRVEPALGPPPKEAIVDVLTVARASTPLIVDLPRWQYWCLTSTSTRGSC